MTDHYTEQDLDRDLGITHSNRDGIDPVRDACRARPGERQDALLSITLGVGNVTEADRVRAAEVLADAEAHPWRLDWPTSEALSRRGEEELLAELYESRLGESKATAEKHVHRVLSTAWGTSADVTGKLDAVARVLESERARLERMPARAAARTTAIETGPRAQHPSRGRYVTVSERSTARPSR